MEFVLENSLRLLNETTTDEGSTGDTSSPTLNENGLTEEQQASHDEVEHHPLHMIKTVFIVLKCSVIALMMVKGIVAYARHPQLSQQKKIKMILPMALCIVVAICVACFDLGPKSITLLFVTQFLANYISLLTLTFLLSQVENEQFQKIYKVMRIPLGLLHVASLVFFIMGFIPSVGAYCTTEQVYPWIFEAINLVWTFWYILVIILFCERHKLSNDYLAHEREVVLKLAEKSGDLKAIERAKANIAKAPEAGNYNTNINGEQEVSPAEKTQQIPNTSTTIQNPIDDEITESKVFKPLPKPGEKWDLATVALPHPDLIFQYQLSKFMCYMTVLMILKMFKTVIVNVYIREQQQITCMESKGEWVFTNAIGDVFMTINIIFAIMQCVMCEQIIFTAPEIMGLFGPPDHKTCAQKCCCCFIKKDKSHLDGADQDAIEMKLRQGENVTIQQLQSQMSSNEV